MRTHIKTHYPDQIKFKYRTLTRMMLVVLTGLGLVTSGQATLFLDNFEDDTLNADPSGWTIVEGSATNMAVIAGSSTGGSGANAQVFRILESGSPNSSATRPFDVTSYPEITMSFSVNFTAATGDMRFLLNGTTPGNGAAFLRARPGDSVGGDAGFTYLDASGFGTTAISDIIEDDWYRVTMVAFLETDTWDLSITNLDSVAAGQSTTITGLSAPTAQTELNAFVIGRTSTGAGLGDFLVDDLNLIAVPEPSVAVLLGAGVGVVWALRRRRLSRRAC